MAGLRESGHEALLLAFSRLRAAPDAAARLAAIDPAGYHRIIMVSPSTACFAARARPGAWPAGSRFSAVGPGTAQAIVEAGIVEAPERVESPAGDRHDADAMLGQPSFREGAGRRILVLAGDGGRRDWADALASRGFELERIELYRREAIGPSEEDWQRLAQWAGGGEDPAFVVTTADAADRLVAGLALHGLDEWARRRIAFCPHERIAARLATADWRDVRVTGGGGHLLDAAIESGLPARGPGNDERTDANCP